MLRFSTLTLLHTNSNAMLFKNSNATPWFHFSCASRSLTSAEEALIYFCAIWYRVKGQLQEEQHTFIQCTVQAAMFPYGCNPC